MKTLALLIALSIGIISCTKAPLPTPSKPTTHKSTPITIYDVKVVLKWSETAPFQAPVLYDSVKTSTWAINNLGSPSYNKPDTALHITDWFSTYSNDTVKFCLSENGSGWQTSYTGAPPFRKCEEQLIVNGVIKMDTILSDMPNTSPLTTLIIK